MPWNFADELTRYPFDDVHQDQHQDQHQAKYSLEQSRAYCKYVCTTHYENFTVASWLLPKELRPHFQTIYAYCRWSDDLADETGQDAVILLTKWQEMLNRCFAGEHVNHPIFIALAETAKKFGIPLKPFADLLIAFQQDQTKKNYSTFDELLGYCTNSANPVGHLVLYLFRSFDDERAKLSDEICTGLQLANFWQDVARDREIGRMYLPMEDCEKFDYTQADWNNRQFNERFATLLKFQADRTQAFFDRGKALLPLIPSQLRLEIDLFIRGGEATLRAIEKQGYNVWASRPKVSKWKKLGLFSQALFRKIIRN